MSRYHVIGSFCGEMACLDVVARSKEDALVSFGQAWADHPMNPASDAWRKSVFDLDAERPDYFGSLKRLREEFVDGRKTFHKALHPDTGW